MTVVYPWSLDNFKFSIDDKRSVLFHLNRLKYPIDSFKKVPENKKLLIILNKIIPLVMEDKWNNFI